MTVAWQERNVTNCTATAQETLLQGPVVERPHAASNLHSAHWRDTLMFYLYPQLQTPSYFLIDYKVCACFLRPGAGSRYEHTGQPAAYCRPVTVDRDHTRVSTYFLSITRQPAAYCRPVTVGRDNTRVSTYFLSITRQPAAYCRSVRVVRDHTRVSAYFRSITRQPAAYCRPVTVGRDHTRVSTYFLSITRQPAAYCRPTYAWMALPALLEAINVRKLVIGFE
jgi:hypothetical protein